MADDLKEAADRILGEEYPSPLSLQKAAQEAETLAVHAAYKDMPFIATHLLALASCMNRRLTIVLSKGR